MDCDAMVFPDDKVTIIWGGKAKQKYSMTILYVAELWSPCRNFELRYEDTDDAIGKRNTTSTISKIPKIVKKVKTANPENAAKKNRNPSAVTVGCFY